jgi:regulator of replication initiation timing
MVILLRSDDTRAFNTIQRSSFSARHRAEISHQPSALLESSKASWHHLPTPSLEARTRMAKSAAVARPELEPIDRLEEKIKLLVGMISQLRNEHAQLRNEHARAAEENGRLRRELDDLRSRLADSEAASSELEALRDERDIIRSRVAEMLEQLEAI